MFVPSVRYHTINTSCQNLPKAIYKTVIPNTEFSHAFLVGNKKNAKMTLQPTQIHDDGVGTAGRRTAKPHVPDSIGNAERSMADSFARQQEKNKENHRNAVFPVTVRIKHAKQVKKRRKKQHSDHPTIYRMYMQYSACRRWKAAGAYNGVGRTASP